MVAGLIVRLLGLLVLVGLVWSITLAGAGYAQGQDELVRLRSEVSRLHGQGKCADAVLVAEQYVTSARRKHGAEHTEFATALSWLASVYDAQGRYAEAEPLYRRDLAITEKVLAPDHPDMGASLNNLADLHRDQGRYAEAEPLYRRSLTVREKALRAGAPRRWANAQQPGPAVLGPPRRRHRQVDHGRRARDG